MKDDFQASSNLTLEAFMEQKAALKKEISDIIGFDLSLVDGFKSRDFEMSCIESRFSQHVATKNPVFVAVNVDTRGWRSIVMMVVVHNPILAAFKKDDEWHVTDSSFDHAQKVTPERLKELFHGRFSQVGRHSRRCSANRHRLE